MSYGVRVIDSAEASELRARYGSGLFSAKADINGICMELFTSDREHMNMWEDNFYSISDYIRSHGRIYSINDPEKETEVLLDMGSFTAFLFNFDYYGWIKSIGLGLSGLILEDAHGVFSVHGAALSVNGCGVTLIAPSKTGKTTHSWGLLRNADSRLISDDWYFAVLGKGRPIVHGSEKNCYIDADISDVWKEYEPLVKNVVFDNRGRGIANIRWVGGEHCVIPSCSMKYVFLLKRDREDSNIITKLTAEEGTEYMKQNDMCNPHQLLRDPYRMKLREEFVKKYFSACDIYLVNTILSPEETQKAIRDIVYR